MALQARLRRLLAVGRNAWPTWLFLLGIILAAAVGWLSSSTPEAAVRRAGMILQLIGLGTLAFGLSEMRRLFGKPSLAERVKEWFSSLVSVFSKPRNHTISMGAAAGSAAVMGSARLLVSPGPETSLERRLTILEENLVALQKEVDEQGRDLRARIARAAEDWQREARALQDSVRDAAQKVEEVAVGGLHLETVGLLWLFLGVVATSIPDELALWLTR